MKKEVILLLLLVSPVMAQSAERIRYIDVTFDIQQDLSVRQTTGIAFVSALSEFNYTLNEKVRNVEVLVSGQQTSHKLVEAENGYKLQIFPENPAENLTITYFIDNTVFKSDSINHFFTEFAFDEPVERLNAIAELPSGYGIYQDSYRPSSAVISSDGRRIFLAWNETNTKGALFSVKFSELKQEINLWVAATFSLIFILTALYIHFRKKAKREFMKGFRADEQKVIEFLELHKTCLQSQLQAEFKFSRAKATRIVMRLEEKSLVRKQRYGRTNKLFWLK